MERDLDPEPRKSAERLVDSDHVYQSISPEFSHQYERLTRLLRDLVAASRHNESLLLRSYKPWIALALKWKFDYLTKLRSSPFELRHDIDHWLGVIEMIGELGRQGWHVSRHTDTEQGDWKHISDPFNFMWPLNTKDDQFEPFVAMARQRVEQLADMMGGKNALRGKRVLDVGCGPGRYITAILELGAGRAVGIDLGEDIVAGVKKRFAADPRVEVAAGSCHNLSSFSDSSFDFVISNGVLHHVSHKMADMIREHARVVRPGGYFFIYIAGDGGLELKLWETLRLFLYDVPIEEMYRTFEGLISRPRLQGLLDHCYAQYQRTKRTDCEEWLKENFTEIMRVPGVTGLDVTPELYEGDPFFQARFGSGNLRYLCRK